MAITIIVLLAIIVAHGVLLRALRRLTWTVCDRRPDRRIMSKQQ